MKRTTAADDRARQSHESGRSRSSAGQNGISIAPPGYGIDFVDRDIAGAEVSPLPEGGNGRLLPGHLQARMERALGADFSAVRVHEDAGAASIGALAYTRGTDIHFAPGQYDPGSRRGQERLGHELTHVVQQAQGRVRATASTRGVTIDDDAALEREADDLGARAARGESAPGTARPPVQIRGSGRPAPAVQLLMDKQAFLQKSVNRIHDGNIHMNPINARKDALRDEIGDRLDAYPSLTEPLERMAALDDIEHKTYRLIDESPDQGVKEGGLALLDELQAEHRTVIRAATGWVTSVFSADPDDQSVTDEIWARLRANDKIFVSSETFRFQRDAAVRSFPDFPAEMLSAFARLISRSAGRGLVSKILNHPKNVGIFPLDDVTAKLVSSSSGVALPFVAGSTDPKTPGRLAQQNLDEQGGKLTSFVQDGQLVGSDVVVFLPPGMKDSDLYVFDQQGRRIPEPVFLTLGHELIHAKAMMRGRGRGKGTAKGGIWDDAEELRAIQGGKTSENALRAEHDHLSQRKGHGGGLRHQSAWNMFIEQVSPFVAMLAFGVYAMYLQQRLEND